MIIFNSNAPSAEEMCRLYSAVGWGELDKNTAQQALSSSLYTACAYDSGRLVGFGRLIGDGVMFLYIQDVMVSPGLQGKKIGTQIMNMLVKKASELKHNSSRIRTYLGASEGKEEFYERFGFVTRSDAGLGAGMVML